jgi:predicted metal-binding protein
MAKEKKKIAILACKNIKGISVWGLYEMFQGIAERAGNTNAGKILMVVIGMDDCGGCPGVIIPKMKLMVEMGKLYERDIDAIHLGTCVMTAVQTAQCPIDIVELKKTIEEKFKKEVIFGTHPY